jgi:hypothetical protein
MARASRSALVRRKNFYIRVDTLKKAQKALGTRTETETVERALELVVFQEEALKAFQDLCTKGEIEDVFGHSRRQSSQ